MKLYPNIKSLGLEVSHKKISKVFPMVISKMSDPRIGSFSSQGYNFNNLGRGSPDEATYKISKACAFYEGCSICNVYCVTS